MKRKLSSFSLLLLLCVLLLTFSSFLPSPLLRRCGTVFSFLFCSLSTFFLPASFRLRPDAKDIPVFPQRQRSAALLLLLPAFVLLIAALSLFTAQLFSSLGVPLPRQEPLASLFLTILFDVALAAFTEELFFRGALYSLLAPYGDLPAILGTSLAFSLLHGNLYQIPYALAAGILLGFLRLYSGSLFLPFLFHLTNNLVSLLCRDLPIDLFFLLSGTGTLLGLLLFFLNERKRPLLFAPAPGDPRFFRDLVLSPFPVFAALMLLATIL